MRQQLSNIHARIEGLVSSFGTIRGPEMRTELECISKEIGEIIYSISEKVISEDEDYAKAIETPSATPYPASKEIYEIGMAAEPMLAGESSGEGADLDAAVPAVPADITREEIDLKPEDCECK